MNQHFSEVDLLETYYTQPGESMPIMMHLADCSDCAARYERLEKKMRSLAACEHHKPETFWARQRAAIMRAVETRRSISLARMARVAVAAMLVLVLAGLIATRLDRSGARPVAENPTLATEASLDEPMTRRMEDSPWDSEELGEFHSMVAWESWIEEGDQSL